MEEELGEIKVEEIKKEPGDDEWLDILGSGGLRKKILVEGDDKASPKRGDEVTINAVGYLQDKTQVENFESLTFTLGGGEVVPGFDVAVALMKLSEEAEVFMESRFAYGKIGLEPNIPFDADLLYEIKLVSIVSEHSPEELDIEERKEIGGRKRERGNFWFNRDEYSQAIQCYKNAVDFLDDTSDSYDETTSKEQVKDILEMRLKTLNNMAAAQLKIEAYEAALISLGPVLRCQPNNVKALYRKGKILAGQKKFKEALDNFNIALCNEPDSKLIQTEIIRLRELLRRETESEKSLYRKMLGLSKTSKEEKERHPSLRGKHIKTVAIAFIILFATGMVIKTFSII